MPRRGDSWRITFDGGSQGNPGRAYGSFRIDPGSGTEGRVSRLEFGRGTNNEAEYWTLIAGLREVLKRAEQHGLAPRELDLEVRGDSRLVMEQIRGTWKARDPRMRDLRDQARGLLDQFRSFRMRHQRRASTVRDLGH